METALFWLLLNLITVGVLAFYSMEEMAFVSFNKVRLQYYVSQQSKRALWIDKLLKNPTQLFTTTLIGVNVATFLGSECARQFHEALGLSPDLAPFSQIFLVIIFGELAPMFAARRYSEHVALLGAPLVYLSSLLLAPLIWLLGMLMRASNRLFGGHESSQELFISADELQKILEEQDEESGFYPESREFNAITSNIFRLKGKHVSQIATPLTSDIALSDQTTVHQLRSRQNLQTKYVVIYHETLHNVTGILYVRDLLKAPDGKKLGSLCQAPWFVSASMPLLDILKQFRSNSEKIAIALNHQGKAIGYLTFEDILDEIFGEAGIPIRSKVNLTLIDRTFNGSISLEEFKKETGIELAGHSDETLSSWFMSVVEHHPEAGESYSVHPYEFIVKEASLLEVTSIQVKTQSG